MMALNGLQDINAGDLASDIWRCLRWGAWLVFPWLAACTTAQLNTGGTPTKFELVVAVGVDNTKNHPPNSPFMVNASCASGQQLVGGGYLLINNNAPTRKLPGEPDYPASLVVVEGNFPSSANSWTVQVRNPDNQSLYSGDSDVVVETLAYCVSTVGYDLGIDIVQSQKPIAASPTASTDIEIRCAQTSSIVLSGGFLTTSLPVFSPGSGYETFWPGLLGTGIIQNGPRFPDSANSAMGWHVTQLYAPARDATAPQPSVSTTVFAVCARKSIVDQAHRLVSVGGSLAMPLGNVTASCGPGEFTVGGGYNLTWDATAVPNVSGSNAVQSPFAFDAWSIEGGFLQKPVEAQALCVHIPTL